MSRELAADERLTNAMRDIERIRAEMQIDEALTRVERAADMLLFSAHIAGMRRTADRENAERVPLS